VPVTSSRHPLRTAERPVDVPVAVTAWVVAFFVGQALSTIVFMAAGVEDADETPIPTLFVAVSATWISYLTGAWWASRRSGSGDMRRDYRLAFAPRDLVGVPLGILTQLVVLPLVYRPLVELWPDAFSDDKLSENAERLVDRADGFGIVLLVLMVCLFAPLVEEIVYRGMLQGAFAARFDTTIAVVAASLWFMLIHFRPVEYPGLFAFALVVGAGFAVTGRLGLPIVTHMAFNVTGLALAWP
jgi:membrane protease YdiL (CAAX protease family)